MVHDPQSQQISIWCTKEHKCPYCGSTHFNKNGHRKNSSQKFICKNCGKSFSTSTHTVGYGSHFNIDKWTKFIECKLNGFSHRKITDFVGINRNTSLLWWHKSYDALNYLQNNSLSDQVQLDAKIFQLTLKEQDKTKCHVHQKNAVQMKIIARTVIQPVLSISGVDEEDHLVLKVAIFGKETTDMYHALSS